MRPEEALEVKFTTTLRKYGALAVKLIPTRKGLPDRLVLMPGGATHLVELKAARGRRSAAQELVHEQLAAIGHTVATLYGPDEVEDWLRARIAESADGKRKKNRAERKPTGLVRFSLGDKAADPSIRAAVLHAAEHLDHNPVVTIDGDGFAVWGCKTCDNRANYVG